MSIRLGDGTLVAGGAQTFPLLSTMWADHILNDVSWLRADTFSWQSGDVYKSVYEKLVAEYATGTEETEGAITFKRTESGFKIADSTQEQAILDLYNSTGVAWYYILDTTNRRFKLPRAKHTSTNVDVFGNGITLGLTDGTNKLGLERCNGIKAFIGVADTKYNTNVGEQQSQSWANSSPVSTLGLTSDPTKSGIVGKVQRENDSQYMYLYFYVGNYTQTAIQQTAGLNVELFNGKLDIDSPIAQAPYIVETYDDGNGNWYRVWSDKWCEQGGRGTNTSGAGFQTITLLKEMRDTNYTLLNCNNSAINVGDQRDAYIISTTQIGLGWDNTQVGGAIWTAKGYIL